MDVNSIQFFLSLIILTQNWFINTWMKCKGRLGTFWFYFTGLELENVVIPNVASCFHLQNWQSFCKCVTWNVSTHIYDFFLWIDVSFLNLDKKGQLPLLTFIESLRKIFCWFLYVNKVKFKMIFSLNCNFFCVKKSFFWKWAYNFVCSFKLFLKEFSFF